VRKHRTDSGLIRYDQRRESEWPQVAREIIAAERPKFVVMMIGNNDRQSIRQTASAPVSQPSPPAPAQASSAKPPDLQPVEQQQHSHPTPTQAGQAAYGQWEFQTEKWELAYIKRIDATIAALKSAGVPVIWVGLPSQRSTHATDDASYLNELYRSEAERADIIYVDIWDGFVDEDGKFSPHGPDYLGQTPRLRTSDGVYFTKFGARKLAHYVEREIERMIGKEMPITMPAPISSAPQAPSAKTGGAVQRPAAGPVVSLTETRLTAEELMGGATPAAASGAPATRPLTKGEALAVPSGRADDFSWPRGVTKVEEAAVEPPAPERTGPAPVPKSAKPAQQKSAMDAYATQSERLATATSSQSKSRGLPPPDLPAFRVK
jgi:lysophospholipase L1-like esterase